MILSSDFLLQVLEKHVISGIQVHITDAATRILASTDVTKIGGRSTTAQYIIHSVRPALIENPPNTSDTDKTIADTVVYGTPFFFEGELSGTIIVRGQSAVAIQQGNVIKAALETTFDYQQYNQKIDSASNDRSSIAVMLLSEKPEKQKIVTTMNKIEMDSELLRCVICISLSHHRTSYFNINLSLGYQSSVGQIMEDAASRLGASKYLNSQDIVHIYDRNTIVVIKSFIQVGDLSKIYLSLDKICAEFETLLVSFTSFSFKMAYGNLYQDVSELKKSLKEATQTIDIGFRVQPDRHLYVLENILFDNICHFLNPQIINKILLPTIEKLTLKDGSLPLEIIECAEAFVDNCMSLSLTSEKIFLHRNTIGTRLNKLKLLTGLDPSSDFNDAFIVKMLASYLRLNRKL